MKHYSPFLLVVLGIAFIVLLWYYMAPATQTIQDSTFEKLTRNNHVLEHKNKTLTTQITRLNAEADSMQRQLEKNTQTLQQLEHERNEKINTITSMSAMDLLQYFATFKTDSTTYKE